MKWPKAQQHTRAQRTLYQYFGDKQALLDALVGRELGAMSD